MAFCKNCGAEIADGVKFCNYCGTMTGMQETVEVETAVVETTKQKANKEKKPSNKKKVLLITGIILAVLLVAFIVVGILTCWFGGPLRGLLLASKRTFTADNMTVEIKVSGDNFVEYYFAMSEDQTDFMCDDGYARQVIEGDTTYFLENGGYAYKYDGGARNIADFIPKYAPRVFTACFKNDEDNWEDLFEEMYIDDYVDSEHTVEFVKYMFRHCITNKKWLEEHTDFKRKGNEYEFTFRLDELADELLSIAEDHDLVEYEVQRMLDRMELPDEKFNVVFEVEKNLLKTVEIRCFGLTIDVEFKDINDTDFEKLSGSVKTKVEDYIKAHTCSKCGDVSLNDDGKCWNCDYGYCQNCYNWVMKDYLYYKNGDYYCSDCYDRMGYCYTCGDFCYTYTWNGRKYCWSHY